MSHEVINNPGATTGRPLLPTVKNCEFPARACAFPAEELLRYRRRLLHYMTKLSEGDSAHESIKHSLRAIDALAQDHESISGCNCFFRARQRRIKVENARRERREAKRKTGGVECR